MGTVKPKRRDKFRESAGAIATKLRDGSDTKSTASRLNDNAAATVIEKTVAVSDTHIANMIIDEAKLQGIWWAAFLILLILNVPTTAFWVALKPFAMVFWNIPCIAGALPGDYTPPLRCTTIERNAENITKVTAMRMALTEQESGGDSQARNADTDASGLAQVMPDNITAWSKEILGREVSQEEFLANPDLQVKIIEGKLAQYFREAERRFPGRGPDTEANIEDALSLQVRWVSAKWYSGRGDLMNSAVPQTLNGNFYPSIYDYTVKVLERFKNHYNTSSNHGYEEVTLNNLPVTSSRGMRIHPVTGEYKMHYGTDNACSENQVLISPIDGIFRQGTNDPQGFGMAHNWGTVVNETESFQVGHSSSVLVEDGDRVVEGQAIWVCGSEGVNSTGNHYDTIAKRDGKVIDPPSMMYN